MGQLKDHMISYMTVRGYSPKTIKAYTIAVESLAKYYGRSPLALSTQEVEEYFLHLRTSLLADATIHLSHHAIRYFYRIHGKKDMVPRLRFPGKHHRLPMVLSRVEVSFLLANCTDLRSKTIFHLIYSCGLRISEAINLSVSDIDFERKSVFVRMGKCKKDRYTVLGDRMARLLREYIMVYSPDSRLFYSCSTDQPISTDVIQRKFRELVAVTGLSKAIHVHTLRHCFATHLLENGTNIVYIMKLLGHSNIQTTMIYLHVQSMESMNVQSPIDTLPTPPQGKQSQLEMFQKSA
jgi:site-specific recombinase XerD